MRYAQIRKIDISNGQGIGVALFVQGCSMRCPNCFNPETWDFNGGKEWTEETKKQFLALVDRPYIHRISFLGGEPLAYENIIAVNELIQNIKTKFPDKKIWLYTGKTLNKLDFQQLNLYFPQFNNEFDISWFSILRSCDIIVDGAYVDQLRDLTLPFRGSSNQRLIDVKETIKNKEITLWKE